MKRILIIDDNYDLVQNTMLFLNEHNYDVKPAYSGNEGLNAILNYKPDLILCDIMLPDINGYKILSELKKLDLLIPPILIYITAKTQRNDLRKGMTLGADDYITKPFTFEELLNAINTQFKKRSYYLKSVNKSSAIHDEFVAQVKTRNNSDEKKTFTRNGFLFIDNKKNPGIHAIKDLIVVRSFKDYTILFFVDGKKFLLRKRMNYWESYLPSEQFIRIHRQTMINLNFINRIEKLSSNRFSIQLKGYTNSVDVSQRYSKRIKKMLM